MRTPMMIRLSSVLLVAACASAATGTGGGSPGSSRGSASSVITGAELIESSQTNLLDLIRTIRPQWLRIRGNTSFTQDPVIFVYVDGNRAGSTDALSQISPLNVEKVQYFSAAQAQFRFGVGNVQGAIEVITRQR